MPTSGEGLAIVLRRSDSGESDRRIAILTEDSGKIELYAKGARKAGSRLASSTEPLVVARFQWIEGRARRFITSVEPRTSFPGLRSDYERLATALAWVEVLNATMSPSIPSSEAFRLALATVSWIESEEQPLPSLCYSLSCLLGLEGHQPDWSKCIDTGEGIVTNPVWVSPHAGGFISESSSQKYSDAFQINAEALIALSRISNLPKPPPAIVYADQVFWTLFRFWESICDQHLPACRGLYDLVKAQVW